jgi:predicted ribosome quality control (RQC) complex YloA/Tae2 family protein
MSLNVAEIERVVADLRARLVPARLERVRSPAEEGLLFELRARRADHLLLASLEPNAARVQLVERGAIQLRTAEGFARAVHQAASGSTLVGLEQLGNDRVVRLELEKWAVVLELTGRHANAFLLDEHGIIRSSYRPSQSRKRSLFWGSPYQAPLPREDAPWRTAPSRFPAGEPVHAAIAAAYAAKSAQAVETAARREVLARLRAEARRLERLTNNLQRELAEAASAETWRRRGELLKTVSPKDVPRGAKAVRVVDWFDPATPEVDVPYDPILSVRGNRERCFARARKLARRPATLGPRLAEAERALTAFLADLDVLETAPWDDPTAQDVMARRAPPVAAAHRPRGATRPRRSGEHQPYRTFLSTDGHEILVGKSARDNDRLTFQVARGHDAWLHATGAAGSHVVVRVPKGRAPTETALRDAAMLALHYSKLGRGGEGEVYVARRCDVRRVRGGAPGQVTVTQERRLWVRIEPERLQALLATSARRFNTPTA